MHHDDGPYLPARLALLPAARHYVTNLAYRPGNFAQSPGNRVGMRYFGVARDPDTIRELRWSNGARSRKFEGASHPVRSSVSRAMAEVKNGRPTLRATVFRHFLGFEGLRGTS